MTRDEVMASAKRALAENAWRDKSPSGTIPFIPEWLKLIRALYALCIELLAENKKLTKGGGW